MKIADLWVSLGFNISGKKGVDEVETTLRKVQGSAVGALAIVTALNAAFYAMVASAASAAVSMGKFAVTTGLSSVELQKWQKEASTFGVKGDEIRATLEAINKAQADIKLGQGNVAPFQFFGISVNQSSFDVLKKFAEVSRTMDPAIARTMAAQLGITDNVFQFLRQANLDLERFNRNLFLTEKQQASLVKLNRSWQDIVFSLSALKNRFAETFAEPLSKAAAIMTKVIDKMSDLVEWLGRATPASTAMRNALFGVVVILGAAFVALTALVTLVGTLTAVVKVLSISFLPLIGAMLPFLAVVGLIAFAIGGLILLIEDFEGAVKGEQSLFDWNKGLLITIKNVERLASAIDWIVENWNKISKVTAFLNPGIAAGMFFSEKNLRTAAGKNGGIVINNSHDIDVKVDAAGDARSVGREVGKSVRQAVIDTSGQIPPPVY